MGGRGRAATAAAALISARGPRLVDEYEGGGGYGWGRSGNQCEERGRERERQRAREGPGWLATSIVLAADTRSGRVTTGMNSLTLHLH
jgi:hypothetical protein